MDLESFFMTGYVKYYWKCTKINYDFTDFCYLPRLNWNFFIFKHLDDV